MAERAKARRILREHEQNIEHHVGGTPNEIRDATLDLLGWHSSCEYPDHPDDAGLLGEPETPTEEQLSNLVIHGPLGDYALGRPAARAVLALFPGESREAVEAAQRERDAQIAERIETRKQVGVRTAIAAAIREAGRG